MAAIFWVYRLVKVFCNVLSYWEIRQFYIKALKIRMVSVWRILVSLVLKEHVHSFKINFPEAELVTTTLNLLAQVV